MRSTVQNLLQNLTPLTVEDENSTQDSVESGKHHGSCSSFLKVEIQQVERKKWLTELQNERETVLKDTSLDCMDCMQSTTVMRGFPKELLDQLEQSKKESSAA